MKQSSYSDLLAAEADFWGRTAEEEAKSGPPDWTHHRRHPEIAIAHAADIDAMLSHVRPGKVALELGCGAGWLTLAMAQRGANAIGLDIAEKAIRIARDYYELTRPEVSGSARYRLADLNKITLPTEAYDLVVAFGILHHLPDAARLVTEAYRALKPGGLFWVSDKGGHEAPEVVLAAGAVSFLIPTLTPYREKTRALLRLGLRTPGRMRASMESDGLSPFEGAGRATGWRQQVGDLFGIEEEHIHPAFTGYVAAQACLPDALCIPFLRALRAVDSTLVRSRLLRSTGVTLYARKTGLAVTRP